MIKRLMELLGSMVALVVVMFVIAWLISIAFCAIFCEDYHVWLPSLDTAPIGAAENKMWRDAIEVDGSALDATQPVEQLPPGSWYENGALMDDLVLRIPKGGHVYGDGYSTPHNEGAVEVT